MNLIPCLVSNHIKNTCDTICLDTWNESHSPNETNKSFRDKCIQKMKPQAKECFASVIMVDISGYSSLCSTHSTFEGTEELSRITLDYLDKIINVITLFDGDIVKFLGDAVICYWTVKLTATDVEKSNLVTRSVECCLELITLLGSYKVKVDKIDKTIGIHIGLGVGNTFDIHVGGYGNRWEHYISGDAINQLRVVLDLAKSGELAVSYKAFYWLTRFLPQDSFVFEYRQDKCIVVVSATTTRVTKKVTQDCFQKLPNIVQSTALEMYKMFINESILYKLDHRYDLRESRQVTILFLKIGESLSLEKNQIIINIVLDTIYNYNGTLRQMHTDDKGTTLLIFFGLPPYYHENNVINGLETSIMIKKRMTQMNIDFSIGLTTGIISIGCVGNEKRIEYSVMGDPVNMAARFMCNDWSKKSILCDEKTFISCRDEYIFQEPKQITVKGKNSPLHIYTPIEKRIKQFCIVGLEQERRIISNVLGSRHSKVLVIHGEDGMGLSTIAHWVGDLCTQLGLLTIQGHTTTTNKNLYFWKNIKTSSNASVYASVYANVNNIQKLDSILSDDKLYQVLKHIFDEFDEPIVLMSHETQLIDTRSWGLLKRLFGHPKLIIILFSKKNLVIRSERSERSEQGEQSDIITLHLNGLSLNDTCKLLLVHFGYTGCTRIHKDIIQHIYSITRGKPSLVMLIATTLAKNGSLVVQEGELTVNATTFNWNQLADNTLVNLGNIILSQLDRLDTHFQYWVKATSMMQQPFLLNDIPHLFPKVKCLCVDELKQFDKFHYFKILSSGEGGELIKYESLLVKRCVYLIMTRSQKQLLINESSGGGCDNLNKNNLIDLRLVSQEYLTDSVDSIPQSVRYYNMLIGCGLSSDVLTRSQWHMTLGKRYFQQLDYKSSKMHLIESLRLVGVTIPRFTLGFKLVELNLKLQSDKKFVDIEKILSLLAKVYMCTGEYKRHVYCVLLHNNVNPNVVPNVMYASVLWFWKNDKQKAITCLESIRVHHQIEFKNDQFKNDQFKNDQFQIEQFQIDSTFFWMGEWDRIQNDLLKCIILHLETSNSLEAAKKLYGKSCKMSNWIGKFWSCCLMLMNNQNDADKTETLELLEYLWEQSNSKNLFFVYTSFTQKTLSCCNIVGGWMSIIGLLYLVKVDAEIIQDLDFCKKVLVWLDKDIIVKNMTITYSIKCLFKGFLFQKKSINKAMLVWKKGLEKSTGSFMKDLLYSKINKN